MVGASEGGGGVLEAPTPSPISGVSLSSQNAILSELHKRINNNKNRKMSSDPQVVVGYRQCVAGCRMKMLAAS